MEWWVGPDMTEVRVLVHFRMLRVQSQVFWGSFQMILHGFAPRNPKNIVFSSSTQNHAESFRNFVKNSVLDPTRAKLNQNSDFGHVRTYSWLHKLRNTQGKIYGTYLRIIYGIYKEYTKNTRKHLWYKIIRNTGHRDAAFSGDPNGAAASHYSIS